MEKERVCSVCWEQKKTASLLPITPCLEKLIIKYVYEAFSVENLLSKVSGMVCMSCKRHLYSAAKNVEVPKKWLDTISKVTFAN